MVLGTVELGMRYGINNNEGKPTKEQAFHLLDTAWEYGIRELDTAAAYGDAERVIGEYHEQRSKRFLVDTKMPPDLDNAEHERAFLNSKEKLNVDTINILYLHSFEQCKDPTTVNYMRLLKENRLVKQIGVSIYEPQEMKYIIDNLPEIDVIQFPYNILDNYRWEKDNLLQDAHQSGICLYSRSLFLQGLLFKNPQDRFVVNIGAEEALSTINAIASECGVTISQLAYTFVERVAGINEIIMGCQNSSEVKNNLDLTAKGNLVPDETLDRLRNLSETLPAIVVDPRKWKAVL